jgi:DNA-binding IclR family transcriptional regulator
MTERIGGTDGVQTVSRGMQVLRAFRSDRIPLGNAELVRRTGLSKATVSRLTSTLVQLGFLRNPPGSREFELATAALSIGHAFVASSELLMAAQPVMQDLADELGVSVALAMPNELDMLYVGYCASEKVATLRLGVGSVLPMAFTAVGHAWLWAQPRTDRLRLLRRLEEAAGPRWLGVADSLEESFVELEEAGTCCLLGKLQRDVFAIALPVRIGREGVVMGLSCGKAKVRPDLVAERKRIAPALRKTAAQLEARLADFSGRL